MLEVHAQVNATHSYFEGMNEPYVWNSDCEDAQCVCRRLAKELEEACELAGDSCDW